MGRVPSRGSDQFIVRFPDGMRERLKSDAALNGRSLNAEIIHRLEKYPKFWDDIKAYEKELAEKDLEIDNLRAQLDQQSHPDIKPDIAADLVTASQDTVTRLINELVATRNTVESIGTEQLIRLLAQRVEAARDEGRSFAPAYEEVLDLLRLAHSPVLKDREAKRSKPKAD